MSEIKGDDFPASDDEISNNPNSKMKTDHSMLDPERTIDNNGSCVTLQGTTEEQPSSDKPTAEERKSSISDELGVLELSKSDKISITVSLAEDIPKSTPIASSVQTDILRIEGECSKQKLPSPRSPIKRRLSDDSLKQDSESSPGSKKTTPDAKTSPIKDKNPILLSRLEDAKESSGVFPSAEFSEKANIEVRATPPNVPDDTHVFTEPEKVIRKVRVVTQIADAYNNFKASERSEIAKIMFPNLPSKDYDPILGHDKDSSGFLDGENDPDDESDPENTLASQTSDVSSKATSETEKCVDEQVLSDIKPIKPTVYHREKLETAHINFTSIQTDEKRARLNLFEDIEYSVIELTKKLNQISVNTPDADEKRLVKYLNKYIRKLDKFQISAVQLVDDIYGMMPLFFVNASLLNLKVNNALKAGLDVYKLWTYYEKKLDNNKDSITVKMMSDYNKASAICFEDITIALNRYLKALPADYPHQRKDSK